MSTITLSLACDNWRKVMSATRYAAAFVLIVLSLTAPSKAEIITDQSLISSSSPQWPTIDRTLLHLSKDIVLK